MTRQHRQPKGVPAGGQFAELDRADGMATLSARTRTVAVPIQWTTMELPSPRHRVARPVVHHDHVDVDIIDVTGDEAPEAFTVPDGLGGRPLAIRELNGKLYRPLLVGLDGDPMSATEEAIRVTFEVGSASFAETRDEAVALARQPRKIIVDGCLWRETSPPGYVIRTYGLGFNNGQTALTHAFEDAHLGDSEDFYSADEYDAAVEAAVELAVRRRDNDSVDGIRATAPIVDHRKSPPAPVARNRVQFPEPYDFGVDITTRKRQYVKLLSTIPGAVTESIEAGVKVRRVDYSKLTERQQNAVHGLLMRAADEGVF